MNKTKLIWGIVIGVFGVITLFCLSVCVSCSITGMTFPDQIVDWFTSSKDVTQDIVEIIATIN